MEELNFKERIKNATRRFSRKGSYDCDFKVPSFKVKTVCAEGIPVASLERAASNEAVDNALAALGSLEEKNKHEVVLKISIRDGVQIVLQKNRKKEIYNYKMRQVGYCNVDKRYPNIFVFMAAKVKTDLRCHIFSCDASQKARAICLTMAKAFENSFENWQKSKEMSTPELNINNNKSNNRLVDRRRSADVIQVPTKKQLEKRRVSDFVTMSSAKRLLDVRRSSADAIIESSDEDCNSSCDDEMAQAFEDILSKSAEKGTCSLLRRGSTDWDAIARDEEIQRKMEGDLILWE